MTQPTRNPRKRRFKRPEVFAASQAVEELMAEISDKIENSEDRACRKDLEPEDMGLDWKTSKEEDPDNA